MAFRTRNKAIVNNVDLFYFIVCGLNPGLSRVDIVSVG